MASAVIPSGGATCPVRIASCAAASVGGSVVDAGADLVNDVSGLEDPDMAPRIASRGCPVVVLHMRGTPETMQRDTRYDDLVGEVLDGLATSIERARSCGVARHRGRPRGADGRR